MFNHQPHGIFHQRQEEAEVGVAPMIPTVRTVVEVLTVIGETVIRVFLMYLEGGVEIHPTHLEVEVREMTLPPHISTHIHIRITPMSIA